MIRSILNGNKSLLLMNSMTCISLIGMPTLFANLFNWNPFYQKLIGHAFLVFLTCSVFGQQEPGTRKFFPSKIGFCTIRIS